MGEGQGLFGLKAQERGFWLISRSSEDFVGRKEFIGFGEGAGRHSDVCGWR